MNKETRRNTFRMKVVKVFLSLGIICTALVGDFVVFKSEYSQSQVFRAVADGLVHLSVGFLSALLFFCNEINVTNFACLCNVAFCTVMSSVIDIDHVFVAKSFYLKDMTSLKQRGIFHCTTFWFIISTALLIYSNIAKKLNIYMIAWMIIIAYTSHHIRDANRRGLWLYPFGSSPPIPKYLYLFLLATLPHLYAYLFRALEPAYEHTVIHYDYKLVV